MIKLAYFLFSCISTISRVEVLTFFGEDLYYPIIFHFFLFFFKAQFHKYDNLCPVLLYVW